MEGEIMNIGLVNEFINERADPTVDCRQRIPYRN